MKEINVTGQKRTDLGKKASKTLRKEGFIPCNLYGEKKGENGAPEAMSFAVPFAELRKVIYTPHVYVISAGDWQRPLTRGEAAQLLSAAMTLAEKKQESAGLLSGLFK